MVGEEDYEEDWQETEDWYETHDGYWADDQTRQEGYWANEDLYYKDEQGLLVLCTHWNEKNGLENSH
eukprot:s334_g43.t1